MADDRYEMGRLSFVVRPAKGPPGEGDQPLGLDAPSDGVFYVPETAEPGAPLLIFLHGAMGAGHHLRAVLAAVRPIRRATSSICTSSPRSPNSARAASSTRARLRSASARRRRGGAPVTPRDEAAAVTPLAERGPRGGRRRPAGRSPCLAG